MLMGLRSGRMQALWQDARQAIRTLSAAPGHAAIVMATIALGLSANITMFSVFNAYMFRPLPVRDPSTLFRLSWSTPTGGVGFFTSTEADALRAPAAPYADALSYEPLVAAVDGRPLFGNVVSGNYFSMLAVQTSLGRPLVTEDGAVGASPVVVLSHSVWQSRFDADRAVLGKTLLLFGRSYEIVGVAPPGFDGIGQVPADCWIARTLESRAPAPSRTVVVRLRPGFTARQTEAAMLAWAKEMTSDRPVEQRATAVHLQSNAATLPMNSESMAGFVSVAAACLFVLLIAAANVANMVLARALTREREMRIRMALGARRARIVQQLLTESVLVTLLAAAAALLMSRVILRAAESWLLATIPPSMAGLVRLVDFSPDARVFLFLLGASMIVLVMFGVLPALQATSGDRLGGTRGTAAPPSGFRSRLIAGQMTACVLLLICTGVLVQASRLVGRTDPQLVTRGVWIVQVNHPIGPEVAEDLRSRDFVAATASASHAPLTGSLRRLAAGPADGSVRVSAGYNFVSPEYFPLLGIPLVKGRAFTALEAASDAAVVIVSAATAARFWPNQDPLGREITIGPTGWQRDRANRLPRFRTAQVVGVAQDVVSGLVFEGRDETCLYFPRPPREGAEALLVRSHGDAERTRRGLEIALDRSAAGAVMRIAPLDELFAVQVYPFRLGSAVSACLGGLAMALTVSGIFGVVSFLVGRRQRELGIRMALGASPAAIVRGVVLESLRPAALGTAIGVVCALSTSRLVAAQLGNIDAFDRPAYVCAIVVALCSAGLAALLPSCRAARHVNPARILHSD